jgi:hypothetical protein
LPSALTALNPEAQEFLPSALTAQNVLPDEVAMVVAAAKQAMVGSSFVTGIKVSEAPVGAVTTISGKVTGIQGLRSTIRVVKGALLAAARRSQDTYIMGVSQEPFKDVSESEFKAKIITLPEALQATACWDTLQKGFCPRRGKCCWQHPQEHDMVTLRVVLTHHGF